MSVICSILGILIILLTLIDILFTVLAPNSSGIITGKIAHWLWRFALLITGRNGRSNLLSNIGVFLLIFIVQVWVVLIWLGTTLIVYSDPHSLYNQSQTAHQTDFVSTLYFSGYVLSAMGHGDYSPTSDWWKFYTAFISFTGVIFISLSISYLIPVMQAVTNKRLISLKIHALGSSPCEIIIGHWKNNSINRLVEDIYDLREDIFKLAQQHLAYPIIHYFHSTKLLESTSVSLAALDETITILEEIIPDENKNDSLLKLERTRLAITYYLSQLESGYIDPSNDKPILPDLDYLSEIAVLTPVGCENLRSSFLKLEDRRKLLLAYVQNDAWEWEDVTQKDKGIGIF